MAQRKCLKCEGLFESTGIENRICKDCKKKNKRRKLGNQNKNIHSVLHGKVVYPFYSGMWIEGDLK